MGTILHVSQHPVHANKPHWHMKIQLDWRTNTGLKKHHRRLFKARKQLQPCEDDGETDDTSNETAPSLSRLQGSVLSTHILSEEAGVAGDGGEHLFHCT